MTAGAHNSDPDIAIVGGGPAGSALGCYLADAGVSCAIFERERFPRPHVGESLVTAANRVLLELGVFERLEAEGFPRKYGAAWTSPVGLMDQHDFRSEDLRYEELAYVAFSEHAAPTHDYTFHVDRARFDQILLERARDAGALVYEETTVSGVDFRSGASPVLHLESANGDRRQCRPRLIADASGRGTLLGRALGLKIQDPLFDQYAVHAWFEDLDRFAFAQSAEVGEYIFIHFLPLPGCWVWQIPIDDRTTSVGVVGQKSMLRQYQGDIEAFFYESIASRPALADVLHSARRIRPLKAEGEYSYAMKEICGDGFVLLGDAARFVDPIFSSGVSIALNGARFAAEDILRRLRNEAPGERGVFRKSDFASYEQRIRNGTRNWYEFITLYYRLNVLFTQFVGDPRYRAQIVRLLQGDVYEAEEPAVLGEMRRTIEAVESDPAHLWHAVLGELRSPALQAAFR